MPLSNDLISQFVQITNDKTEIKRETTTYGTIVRQSNRTYVKIDGSELLTPISSTTTVSDGDRVMVMIKNNTGTVIGNITAPSAKNVDVESLNKRLDDELIEVDEIIADAAEIKDKLTAATADIETLKTDKLDVEDANVTYAKIKDLDATNVNVKNLESDYGSFKDLTSSNFESVNADIANLEADKISAKDIEGKYANIDFSNIGEAAMEYFYAQSGLIKNVIVGDQTITGELVGVTIKGDLIEGNTIVADKLVVKGEDGLYYKLNTDGVTTETEQTDYNSLNGQVIRAKSITAEKIAVSDLVAFDATIAGFNITDEALYSGVKSSATNTTRGIFLGKDGQIAFGDGDNYIRYYKDENGNYNLDISAENMRFGSTGLSVEETISHVEDKVNNLSDEITTLLRIESSRGTVFKNDSISTVLSVVIYRGTRRITDANTMKSVFGNGAYIQWKWQRLDDDSFGVISSDDDRIGNDGFTFTLSPKDVNTKVTFMCELIM